MARKPKERGSSFYYVRCKKCRNEQIIFSKASTVVKCLKCGEVLAQPTGGKVRIVNSKILEVLGSRG